MPTARLWRHSNGSRELMKGVGLHDRAPDEGKASLRKRRARKPSDLCRTIEERARGEADISVVAANAKGDFGALQY